MTAEPEQMRQFRVWFRSGRCLVVNATGQQRALDHGEELAVAHRWVGRDAKAVKAELLR
jgi:hypothetical protein